MRSRKRSDTSYSSGQLPDPLVFFLDRNLGKNTVANVLRRAGFRAEVHDDHFEPDAPDEEWLPKVGERGWFVITKDQKIRYHNLEKLALQRAGVGAFVLVSKDLTGEQMGQILITAIPAMKRFIARTLRPFIAKITRDGKVLKFENPV